jgi:ComF family protein
VESASSYLYFQKKGITQKLLHQLKYKGQKEVGRKLGLYYGYDLKEHLEADCIIPIPLHKSRLRTRGYNQSEWFGKGLSEAMEIPMDSGSVVRIRKTETQTRKGRYKRWENVEGIFAVMDPEKLAGCHVLLVDDVVTTGATLEACAQALVAAVADVKISVVTIAVA